MSDGIKTSDTYEFAHEHGIIEITANYIGKDSLIDVVKAAIKRDFDLLYDEIKNGKRGANLD